MRLVIGTAALALALSACGQAETNTQQSADLPVGQSVAPGEPAAAAAGASQQAGGAPVRPDLASRMGELVNPSEMQMLFIYYDVAGIPPPIETWVEQDSQILYGPAHQRAARRAQVRSELEAAQRSVQGVGKLRLTVSSAATEYDPTYEEFRIDALAPSSGLSFRALDKQIGVKFGNGQYAQIWRVPRAESQAVLDRMGPYRSVNVDALVQIAGSQPEQNGGAVVVNVLEYELRSSADNTIVGRVRVGS